MKKIIATVLAMVMALALCTTAFAADNYDLYLANSTNISGKVIAANGAVAEKTNKTITITAAASYSDGTGNLEYLTDADSVIYVKTTTPTVADYAVTVTGKKDILFYVTKVDAAPMYAASAKAFTDFGYKCGQVVNNDNSKYYEITTGADAGKVYKAIDNGTLSVLVDGKLVKLDNTAAAVKEHNWSVSASKVENGKVIPTEAVCGICGSKSTAIYETGKAPAGSKVETLNGVTGYVVVPNGTSTTPSTGTTNKSPKTFDAGIAMYVGMALTSVAGSALVIGKKKEF